MPDLLTIMQKPSLVVLMQCIKVRLLHRSFLIRSVVSADTMMEEKNIRSTRIDPFWQLAFSIANLIYHYNNVRTHIIQALFCHNLGIAIA